MNKCRKMPFDSEFAAKARAAFMALTKPHKFPEPLRAYPCYGCHKYHLTSKKERKIS